MRIYIGLILFALVACQIIQKPAPVEQPIPIEKEIGDARSVMDIVEKSQCLTYEWKYDQGEAPAAYIKGMAQVFARSACNRSRFDVLISGKKDLGSIDKDALAHYGMKPGDRLVQLYTLMMGHGMLESSGRHCCGRDSDASNVDSISAEAGLFQTSYDSHLVPGAPKELVQLFKSYDKSKCLLDVFSKDVSCSQSNWKNWGDPASDGYKFQEMSKSCPAFEVEYSAMVLRTNRTHYGPINKKRAEYSPECESMLLQIKTLVETKPEICKGL